jgi:ATP diphosphatase
MHPIERLLKVMERLRDPETGCPWDRQQNFASIVPHTIEEAYEVAEAIEHQGLKGLREELGDLLFQVVFYAQLAREAGLFDFDAVVEGIIGKLTRRHPHVFGEEKIESAEDQSRAWEAHKAKERAAKGEASVLDGVSLALPALTRALKLQRRAARVGFDWTEMEAALSKVEEELRELRAALADGQSPEQRSLELGDLLFSCVNVARFAQIDPESALRGCNAKFEARFRYIEQSLVLLGKTPAEATLEEMDALWEEAKRKLG